MTNTLRIHFITLTNIHASEHIYMAELREALLKYDIVEVDDWRDADVIHLFEVNFYSRAAFTEFEYLRLHRVLKSDIPVVVSTDDLFFIDERELTAHPWLYPLNRRTQCWLFDKCDVIMAVSENVKENLVHHVDNNKIHIVRHGVSDIYRVDHSSTTDDPFVLHVSLASSRKNPDAILNAARRLDIPFKIAGSGWDKLVSKEPEVKNVEALGYVPEDELIELYKRAAIFYFPTLHEGFGLPVLEAMAAGCAVVTSNTYAVPEVTGDAAILLDPNAVDRHVEAINYLAESPNERLDLATQAIDRSQQFSWEKTASEAIEVYRSVLEEGSS